MDIKNIDENGNEIEEVDWSVWSRERMEEVLDDDDNVIELISYCRKYTDKEKHSMLLQELAATENKDIQAALCELAEEQLAYENDVNAALCELYELIEGGDANG